MFTSYSGEGFQVFDDCLTQEEFECLFQFIQRTKFFRINQAEWVTVYRTLDGSPMESFRFSSRDLSPVVNAQSASYRHGVDALHARIAEASILSARMLALKSETPPSFSSRICLYTQGTRLSWHDDGGDRAGAFVFFAHPRWNVQWGGELLCATVRREKSKILDEWEARDRKLQHFDNELQTRLLLESGIGSYVQPRPNRLVIISPGLIHSVNRVDPAAGDQLRTTVTGFFKIESTSA